MTDQELHELDGWIAEHIFGWRQVDTVVLNGVKQDTGPYWWRPDYGDPLDPLTGATIHTRPPRYSREPVEFKEVKREIERRGWVWQAASEWGALVYLFAIFGILQSGEPVKQIASANASTEELAGCLAFRAAVEATLWQR